MNKVRQGMFVHHTVQLINRSMRLDLDLSAYRTKNYTCDNMVSEPTFDECENFAKHSKMDAQMTTLNHRMQ